MSETTESQQNSGGPPALFERIRKWFDEDGWRYEVRSTALVTVFSGKSGEWPVGAEVRGKGVVIIMSMAPFSIPSDRRGATMEAITRANCGLALGAFDLDLDSGAVQFRTSLDVEGDEQALGEVILRHLVYQNVVAMDRYLPALREVGEGAEPEAAIDKVEGR